MRNHLEGKAFPSLSNTPKWWQPLIFLSTKYLNLGKIVYDFIKK